MSTDSPLRFQKRLRDAEGVSKEGARLPRAFLEGEWVLRSFSGCFLETVVFPSEALQHLAHQNHTIAIATDFRVDRAKSPEILQKRRVLGSEIAA